MHPILKQYWGHDGFRPMQEEIIRSVLDGRDTIALLPTGGGKSICYQVPGLALGGLTLVISPLVALMKDQVDTLQKMGIKAVFISSVMSYREIDIALDNCAYGKVKFLYVSPERLKTELFLARVKKMNVKLVAIDEAHCISQWGYDFRPPYLQIAELRSHLPKVPFMALTATATPEVIKDIGERLEMKNPQIFQKSFDRPNLSYLFLKESDKENRLTSIFKKSSGTGIVYTRNRRLTVEVANLLKHQSISADFYHAGLEPEIRNQKQQDWIANKTRVIVCTNAFGMGIDKPDVRTVVHFQPPDCIEAYFQEAGRGGRDGKPAYGVLLYDERDIEDLEFQLKNAFPEKSEIRTVYQALVNYFQLAVGSGKDDFLEFDLLDFCKTYNLNHLKSLKCLDLLAKNDYIFLTDSVFMPSRLMFKVDKNELYSYQLKYPRLDGILKTILRSYSGIFDEFVVIREKDIAFRAKTSVEKLIKDLENLHKQEILVYVPQSSLPKINFPHGVVLAKDLFFDSETFEKRKKQVEIRNQAFIDLLIDDEGCRTQRMLRYFGEADAKPCGRCDVCLQKVKKDLSTKDLLKLESLVLDWVKEKPISYDWLIQKTEHPKQMQELIRFLVGEGKIVQEGNWLKQPKQ
ncbi:MAG: RecQ family ATP-dependent DNA helicase [Bacteroidia bacterium]|nr:RecQ family ATP-dependent DNA helicase [Bacteroidia bacterium]